MVFLAPIAAAAEAAFTCGSVQMFSGGACLAHQLFSRD